MKTTTKNQPRGLRNHNGLNIRYSSVNHWLGQTGSDGAFCVFKDNTWGYRAAFKLLKTYNQKYCLYSVRSIIERWAPPGDGNNTRAYILRVCELTGFRDTDIIVFDSMYDEENEKAKELVRAMAVVENGCGVNDISMDEICKGFEMAFNYT